MNLYANLYSLFICYLCYLVTPIIITTTTTTITKHEVPKIFFLSGIILTGKKIQF